MALQAGYQRLRIAGTIPETRLEIVFGDDDVGDPLLEEGLGLALRIDNSGLEAEPSVKRGQIRVVPELHDG